MGFINELYHSSIGKKVIVGLTGLMLCVYLIVHVAGNLLLFRQDGGAAFDQYAELLPGLMIIRIIEILLFLVFIVHIVMATIVWILNRRARPQTYQSNRPRENSSLFSRIMFTSGSIVFIFLVVHMAQFWYPSRFATEHVSMYGLVRSAFMNPLYSWFYVLAMVLLAFHLRHGFQSALQTFGLRHQRYMPLIHVIGLLFWLVIPLVFAAMPIYFLVTS